MTKDRSGEAEDRGTATGRTIPDRVLGAIGIGMFLAAVWLLLFGGPPDGLSNDGAPPQLQLLAPSRGDTVPAPIGLQFSSPVPLTNQPGGWGAKGFHLHAEIDGREWMPGPSDIRRQADGSYAWAVAKLSPGDHSLRIVWSDADHMPVTGGGTKQAPIVVR
ncbi:MAG: hypothetical protein GEU90_11105 [Gemmatimonas sp.]|nr:hypothetical protein [Gemmatimonas sp.]